MWITITKVVDNYITSDEFTITLETSTDGASWSPLAGAAFTSDKRTTDLTTGNDDGKTTISQGEKLTFTIDVDKYVRITETLPTGYAAPTFAAVKNGTTTAPTSFTAVTNGCSFKVDTDDIDVTITNTPLLYVLQYNYPSRLYGNQGYTLRGFLRDLGTDPLEDGHIKKEIVRTKTPYEDNFAKTMTWDYSTVQYSIDGNTYKAEITATEAESINPSLTFNLPYEWTTTTVGGKAIFEPVNNTYDANVRNPDAVFPGYQKQYYAEETVKEWRVINGNPQQVDVVVWTKVTAPATLNKKGTEYNFLYWSIVEEGKGEVARCYYVAYNYSAFGNYVVTPIYACDVPEGYSGGTLTSDLMTTITFLEYSRNQWNERQKGERSTQKEAMDTVYADFNLSFQNKGELIDVDSETEVGVIIENCGQLKKIENSDEYDVNYSHYNDIADESAKVKSFIRTGSGTTSTGKNLTKSIIDHKNLTNKNRIEYYLGINATENGGPLGNKTTLFRAYSYMKDKGGIITLSTPVFFQVYSTAIL